MKNTATFFLNKMQIQIKTKHESLSKSPSLWFHANALKACSDTAANGQFKAQVTNLKSQAMLLYLILSVKNQGLNNIKSHETMVRTLHFTLFSVSCQHFLGQILKSFFLNFGIHIQISLKFLSDSPTDK